MQKRMVIFSIPLLVVGVCLVLFLWRTPDKPLELFYLLLQQQIANERSPYLLSGWKAESKYEHSLEFSQAEFQNILSDLRGGKFDRDHIEALVALTGGNTEVNLRKVLKLLERAEGSADVLNDRAFVQLQLADLLDEPYWELHAFENLSRAIDLNPQHRASLYNKSFLEKAFQLETEPDSFSNYEGDLEPYRLRRDWEDSVLKRPSGGQGRADFWHSGWLLDQRDKLYGDLLEESSLFKEDSEVRAAISRLNQARQAILGGEIELALCLVTESLPALRQSGHPLYFKARYVLAECQYRLLLFDAADAQFANLVRIGKSHGYISLVGESLWHRGLIALEQHDITKARAFFNQGKAVFEAIGEQTNAAGLTSFLVDTYLETGELKPAWRNMRDALEKVPLMSKPRRLYQVFGMAALLCFDFEFYHLGLAFQERAVHWAMESEEPHAITFSLIWQSRLLLHQGQSDLVARKLQLAEQHCPEQATRAQHLLGVVESQRLLEDQPDRALVFLNRALNHINPLKKNLDTAEYHFSRAEAFLRLGEQHKAADDLEAGLALFETLAGTIENAASRESFYFRIREQYDLAISIHWDTGDHERALEMTERKRARILLDEVQTLPGLGTNDAYMASLVQVGDWSEKLSKGSVALIYHLDGDRIFLWVMRSDFEMETLEIPLGNAAWVLKHGWSAEGIAGNQMDQMLTELGTILLQPIHELVRDADHLILVTEGAMSLFPWSAIPLDGEPLMMHASLSLLPSMNTFHVLQTTTKDQVASGCGGLLAIGNPQFSIENHPELAELDFATDEARVVASFFGEDAQILLEEQATEAAFIHAAGNHRILHFAGHTQIMPKAPLQSCLLLTPEGDSDGVLAVGDVLQLSLPCTELVVLSSCSSLGVAEGHGDGLSGLAFPFLRAGSTAVIASLWPIADEDGLVFMQAFYSHFQDGLTVEQALVKTQRQLYQAGHSWQLWSGFQLLGSSKS
jgi:tetratricopeptide (TPR) repeat protein